MKNFSLLFAVCSFALCGCSEHNDTYNSYNDRMKKLADEAKTNPNDKTALYELERYTMDWDYWNRSYAYGYLGQLAFLNVGGCQSELLPYFERALKDSDYGVRQAGVQAIKDIGSPAVDSSFAALLDIIRQNKEDDVTWSSAAAIGKLKNLQKAQNALPVLLRAVSTPPPEGTPDEAPQLRYFALDSIKELAKENGLNVVPSLEKLLSETNSPCKEHVAQAILELDPANKAAKQVIDH